MAEVVLDANVIVALLYAADSQHRRAVALAERLEAEGHNLVLVDFLVFEALSVLCRRAAQRKTAPPDLSAAITAMRSWFDNGEVRFLGSECERLASSILDIVTDSTGLLNANDALLVALQREGAIDTLATFDRQFDKRRRFRSHVVARPQAVAEQPVENGLRRLDLTEIRGRKKHLLRTQYQRKAMANWYRIIAMNPAH